MYANSPAELARKLRMVIAPMHRGNIEIERIMPANAAKFFMDKKNETHEKTLETDGIRIR